MTFLSIITRVYKRPKMLAKCIASLESQSDPDYQHIMLFDEIGIGIEGTHRKMRKMEWDHLEGQYVYLLDDDCTLASTESIATLKQFCQGSDYDMVFVKADVCERGILPKDWRSRPLCGRIDLGCAIMSQRLFKKAVKKYGLAYDGDFDFISAGYRLAGNPGWLDFLFMRAQRISWGKPE
jgi:hypothetical protein